METFMVNLEMRTDDKLSERTLVGRLLYIYAASAMDRNWGHTVGSIGGIVSQAFPIEQAQADGGDADARAFVAEAKREMQAMIDDGLFLCEPLGKLYCVAYRHWERYQGDLEKRGTPQHGMTQAVADTRDWTKLAKNSRNKAAKWAERYGLDLDFEPTKPRSNSGRTTVGPKTDQKPTTVGPRSDSARDYPVPDPDPEPDPGGTRANRPPDFDAKLQDARLPSASMCDQYRHKWDPEPVEATGGWDVWWYAMALDVIASEAEPKWRAKAWKERMQDGLQPGHEHIAKARQAFGLEHERDGPRYRCECGHVYAADTWTLECPKCGSLERDEVEAAVA